MQPAEWQERDLSSADPSQTLLARLLTESDGGTLHGPEQLIDAFYPELKRLAAAKMRRQPADHSWRPTELVSELYLELVKMSALRPVRSDDPRQRSAFFALAGQAMQWLLIRHTRTLAWRTSPEELPPSVANLSPGADKVAELESMLEALAAIDSQLRSVVEMRVFEGLSIEECSDRLGCSISTVTRNWRFAKRWLWNRLSPAR